MKRAVLTGNFDGLHLGHQALLRLLKSAAVERNLRPAILTFTPHTRLALKGPGSVDLLTSDLEKKQLLEEWGFEVCFVAFDNNFRQLSPEDYVRKILALEYKVAFWAMGGDHRFGANASGGIHMKSVAAELGIEIAELELLQENAEVISSSRIRTEIQKGNLDKAAELLGRPWELNGLVIQGDQLGRTLGFPTANLQLPDGKLSLPDGVWSAWVQADIMPQVLFKAVVHSGERPTLGGREYRLEVHILDQNLELYGSSLRLIPVKMIRKIKQFVDLEELKAQIQRDIQVSREHLANGLA